MYKVQRKKLGTCSAPFFAATVVFWFKHVQFKQDFSLPKKLINMLNNVQFKQNFQFKQEFCSSRHPFKKSTVLKQP